MRILTDSIKNNVNSKHCLELRKAKRSDPITKKLIIEPQLIIKIKIKAMKEF